MINKIKSKRALLDFTQEDLGKALGICKMSISHYEKGKNIPSVFTSLKMANLFNCLVDDIFELEENEKINN